MTEEKSHERQETRFHIVSDIPDELIDYTFAWKDLRKTGMAVCFRSEMIDNKKESGISVRYYITSSNISAEKFALAVRGHWSIENKLHWRLRCSDECR